MAWHAAIGQGLHAIAKSLQSPRGRGMGRHGRWDVGGPRRGRGCPRTGSRRRTSRRKAGATSQGLILPTFPEGWSTPPIFVQGTERDAPPLGSQFPPLAGSALCPQAPCLDEKDGVKGAAFPIGAINPELKSPTAYIFSAAVERRLGASPVGQRSLQRLALDESGRQRQPGRAGQLRRGTSTRRQEIC